MSLDRRQEIIAAVKAKGSFKEPGTGLNMLLLASGPVYYVISDSGSSYSPVGYTRLKDAVDWCANSEEAKEGKECFGVRVFDTVRGDFSESMTMMNIVSSEDLLQFWVLDDPIEFGLLGPFEAPSDAKLI